MVKHLHFNPSNFNQLILSGLLIETYKDDIECHPSEQTQQLTFIQGSNAVENTIEAILKFANADCRKKYFGLNAQQEAVITMVNGVCKDIDTKLSATQSAEDLAEKIGYLNEFWSNSSYQWLKSRFFYCHMNILTLSFRVQEKFPDLLLKYPVFVEQRRLFISDKWLSKRALVSMFANPCNVYQQYDLFPQVEGECSLRSSFGVPAQGGQENFDINQVDNNFVEIQAVEIGDESELEGIKSYHHKQKAAERFTESGIERPQQPVESKISDTQFRNIDSDISKIKTQKTSKFDELENDDRFEVLVDESKIVHDTHLNKKATDEIVGSNVPQEVSAVVGDLVSQVRHNAVGNANINEEAKDSERMRAEETINGSSEANQRRLENIENDESRMKKSLKESFTEHFTRPLKYSTNSLADKDDQVLRTEQKVKQTHQVYQKTHEQVKRVHEQEIRQEKVGPKAQQPEQQSIQLKKEVIIDEAESEKYMSQEQFDHKEPKNQTDASHAQVEQKLQQPLVSPQTIKQTEPERQVNPQQGIPKTKPPQSESITSQKGPKTDMQQSIKPREQGVQKQKESCKCEIF